MECAGLNPGTELNVDVILLLFWISGNRHHKTLNRFLRPSPVTWGRSEILCYFTCTQFYLSETHAH